MTRQVRLRRHFRTGHRSLLRDDNLNDAKVFRSVKPHTHRRTTEAWAVSLDTLVSDYEAAARNYRQWWSNVDLALQRAVDDHPSMSMTDVYVKISLVDSIYQAGLARSLGAMPHAAAARAVASNEQPLTRVFDQVKADQVLSRASLGPIMEAHDELCRVLSGCRPNGKTPRSFAAKYLHFMSGTVPIYDSRAAHHMDNQYFTWSRAASRDPELTQLDRTVGGDTEYRRYCLRFVFLYEFLAAQEPTPSVKVLDHLLWWGSPIVGGMAAEPG